MPLDPNAGLALLTANSNSQEPGAARRGVVRRVVRRGAARSYSC
jgi:hypothetical protein